jgi:hypothetical protein
VRTYTRARMKRERERASERAGIAQKEVSGAEKSRFGNRNSDGTPAFIRFGATIQQPTHPKGGGGQCNAPRRIRLLPLPPPIRTPSIIKPGVLALTAASTNAVAAVATAVEPIKTWRMV